MVGATIFGGDDAGNGRRRRRAHIGRRAASFAFGLSLLAGQAVHAQDNTAGPKAGADVLAQLARGLSQPNDPILPVTAERLELAREMMAGVAPGSSMSAIGDLLLSEALPKFQEKLKSLPERQQALASAAFSSAFKAAESRRQIAAREQMAAYYAARLSVDDLKTLIAWNGSDLTRRMRTDPKSVTAEERQEAGRYALEHPAVLKLTSLVISYVQAQQAEKPAIQAAFQTDFQHELCRNLATTGVRLATCPMPGPQDLAGLAKQGPVPAGAVHWLSTPQGPALSRYYPERAQRLNKSGAAQAVCTIATDGRLSDCAVMAEAPAGFAFGDALLKLSRFYQAAPETPAGLKVVIALNFKLAS